MRYIAPMLFWALEAFAALFIWFTSSRLPARVASHFDASGNSNGFLSQWFVAGLVFFLIATLTWVLSMIGHFRNVPR